MREILLFCIKENHYAIDVKYIKEVIDIDKKVNNIPNSKPYLIGLLLHRNKALPIIDLSMLLLRGKNSYNNKIAIIVKCNQELIGFLIDQAYQVIKLEDVQLMPLPDNFKYRDESIFYIDEKPHHLLSINRLSSVLTS